ncbi:MAG TPA: hypothetical protein VHG29_04105 [Novosphingobium sp.]|nr:hypothetical protein [Novosphingobium sp.]
MTTELLKLAGSLAAILLIFLVALKLRLGGDIRLRSEAEARELADHAVCGFDAVDVALDRAGIGALLRDRQGRVMLLRRHGAHFASRLLDGHADTRLDHNFLTIGTGERRFGSVTLDLGAEAQVWASSLRHLGSVHA